MSKYKDGDKVQWQGQGKYYTGVVRVESGELYIKVDNHNYHIPLNMISSDKLKTSRDFEKNPLTIKELLHVLNKRDAYLELYDDASGRIYRYNPRKIDPEMIFESSNLRDLETFYLENT